MQHASGESKEDASCTKDQVEMAAGSSRDGCLIEQAEGEGAATGGEATVAAAAPAAGGVGESGGGIGAGGAERAGEAGKLKDAEVLGGARKAEEAGGAERGGGGAAVAEAEMGRGEGAVGMPNLSDAVLNMTLSFLDSVSLVSCQTACRLLGSAAKSDNLWRARCLEDWGESRCVGPSQMPQSTFLDAWRAWRRAFHRYEVGDVARVAIWWSGIKAWMSMHLPTIVGTLNPGASEEDLDRAEELLGWPLPTDLRLLYRFHNGQYLAWDELLNGYLGVDAGRPTELPAFVGSGTSLGLLGGYCFYGERCTSKLFSIQRGVDAGLITLESFGGGSQGFYKATARTWGTDLDAVRARGGFLLAASDKLSKRTWVDREGNVRYDGKMPPLFGVFDAAPVVPSPPLERGASYSSGGKPRARGNLMAWLEEYLRRLKNGDYAVRSRWEEAPGVFRRGIWLFPQKGGQGCSTQVTNGVEIQVSPVLIPEECTHRKNWMWAYSVRMKLLRDHPTRPQGMTSCQLSTRLWEIDGADGYHREISGDGVIGKYPILSIPPAAAAAADDDGGGASSAAAANTGAEETFEYESCTTLDAPPGRMKGHFRFTPGSLASPTGHPFDAQVPAFDLIDPSFLF
eukprot:jgi/Undpi1/341/HiC_scaffold_1.g00337.m1